LKGEGIIDEQLRKIDGETSSTDWEDWRHGGCGDWWQSDRLDGIGWAAIFFWGALVLLAQVTNFAASFIWWDGWTIFLTGAGIIVLLEAAARLLIPEYRQRVVACMIFGFVLMGMALGDLGIWDLIWPIALLIIAGATLKRALTHQT
jgi:hypothetical protein